MVSLPSPGVSTRSSRPPASRLTICTVATRTVGEKFSAHRTSASPLPSSGVTLVCHTKAGSVSDAEAVMAKPT
jgi:hypothetical protein